MSVADLAKCSDDLGAQVEIDRREAEPGSATLARVAGGVLPGKVARR